MFSLYIRNFNSEIFIDNFNTLKEAHEIAEIYENGNNEFVVIKNGIHPVYWTHIF